MKPPVALFFFNREQAALQVFERIREWQPEVLLLIADAGRPGCAGEVEHCLQLRQAIEKRIDWPCEVRKNYAKENLGCKHRITSGMNWIFESYESCILLEDDCLPHPTFFPFCQELLQRYRDEERVMMISGTNLTSEDYRPSESYCFISYPHAWGWATWRRAWRHHDVAILDWPLIRDGKLRTGWLADSARVERNREICEATYQGQIDTWDYQWMIALWKAGGLSIQPAMNLISNIGFGPEATHTFDSSQAAANLPVQETKFPLVHPSKIDLDRVADRFETALPFCFKVLRRLQRLRRLNPFRSMIRNR